MALLLAIDQGTTSSRALVFDSATGEVLASSQHRHAQICPRPGWCEHNPSEILGMVTVCLDDVARALTELGRSPSDVRACGLTCQRETVVVWDRKTGIPLYNAIVWLDTRTRGRVEALKAEWGDRFQARTGLPFSTYFSASKLEWLWENVPAVRAALARGSACVGTIDSWLMFKLLAKAEGQADPGATPSCRDGASVHTVHKTDVTNASRTFLYDIVRNEWDPELCELFHVPLECLPTVHPSASMHSKRVFGVIASGPFAGVPVAGVAGDQHASLFGHCCFTEGSSKCTFGTGAFLLQNAGPAFRLIGNGILTTVAYRLDESLPATYAFEGSIAIAGSALEWLRAIGVVDDVSKVDEMVERALQLEAEGATDAAPQDKGKDRVVFVPAFSGLYCPYWRSDARGVLVGITQHTTRHHIVKAALEAVAFQVNDLVSAFSGPGDQGKEGKGGHEGKEENKGGPADSARLSEAAARSVRISASSPLYTQEKLPQGTGAPAGEALACLSVDGGMTKSSVFLRILADILHTHIKRPETPEITSLGVAAMAGLTVGVYPDLDAVRAAVHGGRGVTAPAMPAPERGEALAAWRRALERSFGLAD